MKTRRDLLKLAAASSIAAACKAPAQGEVRAAGVGPAGAGPADAGEAAAAKAPGPWPDEARLRKANADARAAMAKVALRNADGPDLLPHPRPAEAK